MIERKHISAGCEQTPGFALRRACAVCFPAQRIRMVTVPIVCAGMVLAILGFAVPGSLAEQPVDRVPEQQRDVGVEQKLGAQVPLNLEFLNSSGDRVRLKDYLDGTRPVILTLNYFTCPMLCSLQLEDMVDTLKWTDLDPKEDFAILTVSFDLLDQPKLARAKRDTYLNKYDHPNGKDGWFFLTGKRSSVQRLTDSVGFSYKWDEKNQEYSHSAVMILISPTGKVTRYLGLNTEPEVLRLSLVEASEGKTGSIFDQLFLWCYHYDPDANSYAAVAMNIMRLGGVMVLGVLGMVLGTFWLLEYKRRKERQLAAV